MLTFNQFLSEESSQHFDHPFHQALADAGMKHNYITSKGQKTTYHYMPDHHWKSGVSLHTQFRKGKEPKHSWKSTTYGGGEGNDLGSLQTHLGHIQSNYDAMVARHKAGSGEFDASKASFHRH